ncbi:hypothetical protein [Flexivirga meconopsidis]|uniref:hypothetical protein n=1 Tax=Flexivirga meconopsidis TaxID=2977121 RepID=UPI0024474B32|nr:hypothetical protein [Flexivirga meconopsidis]
MRLIVGMTGATGAPFGVALLEALADINRQCRLAGREQAVETYLIMTRWARTTVQLETSLTAAEVASMADHCFGPEDQTALVSSGSFKRRGWSSSPAA